MDVYYPHHTYKYVPASRFATVSYTCRQRDLLAGLLSLLMAMFGYCGTKQLLAVFYSLKNSVHSMTQWPRENEGRLWPADVTSLTHLNVSTCFSICRLLLFC